jgi:hypothetical protein
MLELLFFLFCLFSIGEPWRFVLRKLTGLFGHMGCLQILLLDVYLGGLFLYVIAVIPLHLFNTITLYTITLVSITVVVLRQYRRIISLLRSYSLRKLSYCRVPSLEPLLIVLILSLSLVVQTIPFDNLIYGSVRDTAIHSLYAQVLTENSQIPVTLQPYLAEGIIYPQGFTPMVAYSMFLLHYLPPEGVLYLTSLFNVLTILGAYCLGETLSQGRKWKIGLSLAFVFAFVASWPKYIVWGSNAFVASFPFFFICLSFFPALARDKLSARTIFVVGVLFGFLSVLHLQVYETLIASLFVLWLYVTLKGEKGTWTRLAHFVAISSVSLLVLSPFIARQLAFYSNPYHNIGVPSDVEIPVPAQPNIAIVVDNVRWLAENLAVDPLLRACSFGLIFVSVFMIAAFRRRSSVVQTHDLTKLGIAMLLGQLLISLLAVISPRNLPFYPQPIMLYFPVYFFLAALNYPAYSLISSFLTRKLLAKPIESELRTKRLMVTAISVMLLLGVYSPFLYRSIALDAGGLSGSYSVFGVTTEQDYKLMMWLKDNLPNNATILVDSFQAGTFIPSIANRKAVFPSFGSSTSASYQRLVGLLEGNMLNATTLALMKRFNITDIFVGSGVSPWDGGIHKWDPKLFQGNPRFKLLRSFGDAYLFHCNYEETNVIFIDDFEHEKWYEYGWKTQYYGNGEANVTIASNLEYHSQRSLRMTAQTIYTALEWRCGRYLSKEILVPDNSSIALSFYLNATQNFNNGNTFAIIISNIFYDQTIVMATPHGIYDAYANAKILDRLEGSFNYNLSTLWRQFFNASLPRDFFLQLAIWNFDGMKSVAYVDNITVTTMPVT